MSSGEKKKPEGESGYVVRLPDGVDARQLEMALELASKLAKEAGSCPTMEAFAPKWIEQYARANRQKPRGIESKTSILKVHLLPRFGQMRLMDLRPADIQKLKADLAAHKPKTVNNILNVLSRMLKVAVQWGDLPRMPVEIHFLPVQQPEISFYEFHEWERLVETASHGDVRRHVMLLLGGDAGLRLGEIIALEWQDVDWRRQQLIVQRSESKGFVTAPKGGKTRRVPMTDRLVSALNNLHLENDTGRILLRDDGTSVSQQVLRTWISKAQKEAGLVPTAALHILRHTFCSHLAMRGALMLAIKELAGHKSLRTTMRYMHLSPTEARRAIDLLGQRPAGLPDTQSARHVTLPGFEPEFSLSAKKTKEKKPGSKRPRQVTRQDVDSLEQWRAGLEEAAHGEEKPDSSTQRRTNPEAGRKGNRPKRR